MLSESPHRSDAIAIWRAGVEAVSSTECVWKALQRDGARLIHWPHVNLSAMRRIVVLGAGKAGAGMVAGFEAAFAAEIALGKVSGWVNVPADCLQPTQAIHLHAARPAAVNEPTEEGVAGTEEILKRAASLQPDDLCVILISGGGSALLPAPGHGISLAEKQQVTRLLMQGGATIQELNTVRKRLSRIKGGGLRRAISAGTVLTLVISDVIGSPLEVIASGPTVPDSSTNQEAIAILERLVTDRSRVPPSVWKVLEQPDQKQESSSNKANFAEPMIIASNETAVQAAAAKAEQMGFVTQILGFDQPGVAREIGQQLAEMGREIAARLSAGDPPVCLISGGEPTVRLAVTDQPRRGGRNQELVLSAAQELWQVASTEGFPPLVILSGGTDGEDGPTDAAGAIWDSVAYETARQLGQQPTPYLAINNSYPFFAASQSLLTSGPTHTNVMDLRVILIGHR